MEAASTPSQRSARSAASMALGPSQRQRLSGKDPATRTAGQFLLLVGGYWLLTGLALKLFWGTPLGSLPQLWQDVSFKKKV